MATLTTFTANTQIKSAEVNANFTGLSDGTMDIDHNSLQVFRDEALFDFRTVTVEGVAVDYTGVFPDFDTTDTTLQYDDNFTTRTVTITMTHKKRYL